jgi:hypothetical protein
MKENLFLFLEKPWGYCDYLNVAKFFIGVGLLIAGVSYKNWIGIIGFYPIIIFLQYLSSPECKVNNEIKKDQ